MLRRTAAALLWTRRAQTPSTQRNSAAAATAPSSSAGFASSSIADADDDNLRGRQVVVLLKSIEVAGCMVTLQPRPAGQSAMHLVGQLHMQTSFASAAALPFHRRHGFARSSAGLTCSATPSTTRAWRFQTQNATGCTFVACCLQPFCPRKFSWNASCSTLGERTRTWTSTRTC